MLTEAAFIPNIVASQIISCNYSSNKIIQVQSSLLPRDTQPQALCFLGLLLLSSC